MARVFRLSLLLLAFIVLVGCSSKASRRDDRPGVGPMITLAAKFPPGHYASVIDASIGTTIRAQGRPGPTVNLVMCMETALDVRQSGDRKTASVSFTRVKADCNGVRADTDTPLPPNPLLTRDSQFLTSPATVTGRTQVRFSVRPSAR